MSANNIAASCRITRCKNNKEKADDVYRWKYSVNGGGKLGENIFLPAIVFHGIACCVTPLCVPFSWHQASSVLSLLFGEGTVLHCKSRPHNPSFSPKERRRCCSTNSNYITSTSALNRYSAFSKTPIVI